MSILNEGINKIEDFFKDDIKINTWLYALILSYFEKAINFWSYCQLFLKNVIKYLSRIGKEN